MVKTLLDGVQEEVAGHDENPLSKESEREILEMVEDQLDRPNPPNTKVLYRRAMHFIDRGVRHLSLQQFNAKFPLQVKRRRARDRAGENGGSVTESSASGNGASSGPAEVQHDGDGVGADRTAERELREVARHSLLDFAKDVAGAEDRGEVIDVLTRVDEYADRVVEEL